MTQFDFSMTEYMEQRKRSTLAAIELAERKKGGLATLLAQRERLAEIYDEDGAHATARAIYVVDIPLIRAAIAAE